MGLKLFYYVCSGFGIRFSENLEIGKNEFLQIFAVFFLFDFVASFDSCWI